MIISDLDYLESLSATQTMHLTGGNGNAVAIGEFSGIAVGSSSYVSSNLGNLVISLPTSLFASSFVKVTAIASGTNAFSSASASSLASVNSPQVKGSRKN